MIEIQADPESAEALDGSRFRGHSIFEDATAESLPAIPPARAEEPDWLTQARLEIEEHGRFLAFSDGGEHQVIKIGEGWTRIGRSAAADLQLDDATVSRRHALIVSDDDRGLRVLDDRSMNGVHLNGERVEWGTLADGDELSIGRFQLFVIDSAQITAGS